jgi:hypothetical protein
MEAEDSSPSSQEPAFIISIILIFKPNLLLLRLRVLLQMFITTSWTYLICVFTSVSEIFERIGTDGMYAKLMHRIIVGKFLLCDLN